MGRGVVEESSSSTENSREKSSSSAEGSSEKYYSSAEGARVEKSSEESSLSTEDSSEDSSSIVPGSSSNDSSSSEEYNYTDFPSCIKTHFENYYFSYDIGESRLGLQYLAIKGSTWERCEARHYTPKTLRSEEHSPILENEMNVLLRLKHPNTVRLVDTIFTRYGIFVFLEQLHTKDLLSILPKYGGITECYAREIFTQLLDGLEYLHQQRIVHCDINIENVAIDHDGNVKIINYEEAEYVPKTRQEDGALVIKRQPGYLNYQAPEVLKSKGRYYRGDLADIWAAGVILFVLVTGEHPFDDYRGRIIRRKIRKCDIKKYPMSTELQDLFRHIFVSPSNRPSIARIREHPWIRGIPFQEAKQHPRKTWTHKAGDVSVTFRHTKLERALSLPRNFGNRKVRSNQGAFGNRRSRSVPASLDKAIDFDSEDGSDMSSWSWTSVSSSLSKRVSVFEHDSVSGTDMYGWNNSDEDHELSVCHTLPSSSSSDSSRRSRSVSSESEGSTRSSTSSSESNSSWKRFVSYSSSTSSLRSRAASLDSDASSRNSTTSSSASSYTTSSNTSSSGFNLCGRAITVLKKIPNQVSTKLRGKFFRARRG